MIINQEKILKEIKKDLTIYGIMTVFMFSILCLAFNAEKFIDIVIALLILFCIFTLPFGCIIGLRNFLITLKEFNKIKNGEIYVFEDEISNKYLGEQYAVYDQTQMGQISLKGYTSKTGNNVFLKRSHYNGTLKKGEKCILIFVDLNKKPILVYPGDKYNLDEYLISKKIGIDKIELSRKDIKK